MLSKVFVVLACAAVALGSIRETHREQRERLHRRPHVSKAGNKIFGGTEAAIGDIPWQVSLQYAGIGEHFCGGAIISDKWVISSGWCSIGFLPEKVIILSGTNDLSAGGSIHLVSKIIVHDDYIPEAGIPNSNIALLQISDTFVWDANTAPVELLSQGVPSPTGAIATVSGWGFTSAAPAEETSNLLKKLQVPIIDAVECDNIYSGPGGVFANEICAGVQDEEGHEFCENDDGGPLSIDGKLHGLVSYNYGCGSSGLPGVYTQVSVFRTWIATNAGV